MLFPLIFSIPYYCMKVKYFVDKNKRLIKRQGAIDFYIHKVIRNKWYRFRPIDYICHVYYKMGGPLVRVIEDSKTWEDLKEGDRI